MNSVEREVLEKRKRILNLKQIALATFIPLFTIGTILSYFWITLFALKGALSIGFRFISEIVLVSSSFLMLIMISYLEIYMETNREMEKELEKVKKKLERT